MRIPVHENLLLIDCPLVDGAGILCTIGAGLPHNTVVLVSTDANVLGTNSNDEPVNNPRNDAPLSLSRTGTGLSSRIRRGLSRRRSSCSRVCPRRLSRRRAPGSPYPGSALQTDQMLDGRLQIVHRLLSRAHHRRGVALLLFRRHQRKRGGVERPHEFRVSRPDQ